MADSPPSLKKVDYALIIALITLSVFLAQFVFRYVDDNRLTSWQWTFADIDAIKISLILVLGIIAAYALSRSSFPERNPVLSLISFSFLAGLLFWTEPEIIVDTSRYFTQAKHLEVYGIKYFIEEWGKGINSWTDLPLVPFLYGLIFKFFGESRLYIQILTTSLFSMTVVFTYLIGKMLWDKDTGFFAGVLLLGIPYLFTQVPLMLVDVPTMFFLTVSIFTFIKALRSGGIWIGISSISIFCAVLSKFSTWLMLSVLGIVMLVFLIQEPGCSGTGQLADGRIQKAVCVTRRHIFRRGALIALFTGVLVGFVIFFKFDVISDQIRLLYGYQRPGLKRWGESFISTFFFQIHPFVTIAAAYSLYLSIKNRDLKYLIICWLIILVFLLQIKRIRYTLPVFPTLALMASYGLSGFKEKELKRFFVSCAVVSSLIVAIFMYRPFLQKMGSTNLKDAGVFLNTLNTSNIEVITIPSDDSPVNPAITVPILDLFTDKDIYYYGDKFLPPFQRIKESSLRFTWEHRNPRYYTSYNRSSKGDTAIAIILNGPLGALPEHIEQKISGYKKAKVYDTSTGFFRYSPIVVIYQP